MVKNTVLTLKKKVDEGGKVTMVTSYDYTMAALVEEAGIDMILVGDSLGMTMMGYDSTIPVTMDDMVHHTRCVTRATSNGRISRVPANSETSAIAESPAGPLPRFSASRKVSH